MQTFKKITENKEADELYNIKLDLISWWKKNSGKPKISKKKTKIQDKIDNIIKLLDEVVNLTYDNTNESINESAVTPKVGNTYFWNTDGYPKVKVKVLDTGDDKNHFIVQALENEPKGDIKKGDKFDAIIDREGEYFTTS